MAERLSRQEIESRIDETEASIAGRFGALGRTVRPGRLAVVRRIAGMPSTRVVSMVVAGVVVGWMAVSITRRLRRRRRTTDRWVDEVLDEVAREKDRGEDDRTALRRALKREAGGGPHTGSEPSSGFLSFLFGYAVRTGVQTLVRRVVDIWSRNGSGTEGERDS